MDAFSYLSVLISIVLGLGLTNLLTGFAGIVRARSRISMFWPLPVQMVLFFLVHVQLWWALFQLQDVRHWSFQAFLVVLMQPVVLYLGTALLVPDIAPEGRVDLRAIYYREASWFYAAILASVFVSLAKNLVLTGRLQNPADLTGHAAFALLAIAGMTFRNDTAQKIIAPMGLAIYTAYIAVLFVSLPR